MKIIISTTGDVFEAPTVKKAAKELASRVARYRGRVLIPVQIWDEGKLIHDFNINRRTGDLTVRGETIDE